MPIQLDLRDIKFEAKGLLQTARVQPLRFALLFLAIDLSLSLLETAVTGLTGVGSIDTPLPFSVSFLSILITLLNTVLLAGFANYCLCIHSGAEMPYESLFDAFPFAGKVILLDVLEGVAIGLGFLLFIVPGVILAFSYEFALYHLLEDPDISVIDAMRRSRREMNGYKWQLFRLLLSFWPLLILIAVVVSVCEYPLNNLFPETLAGNLFYTLITGVISAIPEAYLMPYIELAQVSFFRRATAGQQGRNEMSTF